MVSKSVQTNQTKVLCLAWAPFSGRMEDLSSEIGGKKAIFTFLYGHMYLAPLRYIVLFVKTGLILIKNRPDVIYAQNPSIFCPLSCFPYCKVWRKKLVIDHHAVWSMKTFSSGLLSRIIRELERFAVSRAYANTAPHSLWARELEKLGAKRVLTVYDCVQKTKVHGSDASIRGIYAPAGNLIALAPHGGHPLERIEAEVEAVSKLGGLTLLLSGPESKVKSRIEKINLGRNAVYIGFLPKEQFEQLKAFVDLGLSITDEPYTISHSLLEFAAYSIPTISSNQEAVRELFGDSLLYVDSSKASDVYEALKTMMNSSEIMSEYSKRITEKEEELLLRRKKEIGLLKDLIFQSDEPGSSV